MKRLIFVGALWEGSTVLHRLRAFSMLDSVDVVSLDSMERIGKGSLLDRLRHKLRWPADHSRLNQRLLNLATNYRPDVVFIDSTRVLTRATLRAIRDETGAQMVFYSPDDVSARHNSSRQLESCDQEWSVFFTTKSFNVAELRGRGVLRAVLVGNAFDPSVHRPLEPREAGEEHESFDAVFIGTCEAERLRSINALAEAGVTVCVHGNGWARATLHARVTLRAAVFEHEYTRALHAGKVALTFLRKLNRDLVTTRSVEIPACGRPMVAEKTPEHDELFEDGVEYVSFASDEELVDRVRRLLSDADRRAALGRAALRRCIHSGYSVQHRAIAMMHAMNDPQRPAES